jgi:hypothetical protein
MRERDRVEPRVRAQRAKNLPYVVSDSLLAEVEGRCDLIDRRTFGEQLQSSLWRFVRWTALAGRCGPTTAMPKTA